MGDVCMQKKDAEQSAAAKIYTSAFGKPDVAIDTGAATRSAVMIPDPGATNDTAGALSGLSVCCRKCRNPIGPTSDFCFYLKSETEVEFMLIPGKVNSHLYDSADGVRKRKFALYEDNHSSEYTPLRCLQCTGNTKIATKSASTLTGKTHVCFSPRQQVAMEGTLDAAAESEWRIVEQRTVGSYCSLLRWDLFGNVRGHSGGSRGGGGSISGSRSSGKVQSSEPCMLPSDV